jgi:small-conductance mechanosensitive channel
MNGIGAMLALALPDGLQAAIAQSPSLTSDTTRLPPSENTELAWILTAGILAIALLLDRGLNRIWEQRLRPTLRTRFAPPTDGEAAFSSTAFDLLCNSLLTATRIALWLGVIFGVTHLFPQTRSWGYEFAGLLLTSFTAPILTLGQSRYSLINLLVLMGMFLGLVVLSKSLTDFLKSRILRRTLISRGAQEAIAIILRYSLLFIGSLVLLQIWGLDISSLTILASALGVGIGFGLQDIAKNFGSGLVLIFERPIQVGDFIEVGQFQGTVERIGARSTVIRTLDQVSIIVPNFRFLEQEVINWSHDNPVSRIHLPVSVAHSSNVELVRSLLLQATQDHPHVLPSPKPNVFFKGFGDNSLDFELLVWTAEPSLQVPLKSDLYFRIEQLLRQHRIEVPFPQRDLFIQTHRLPIELSPQLEKALQQWFSQRSEPPNPTKDEITHHQGVPGSEDGRSGDGQY